MKNKEIAAVFATLADLLEIKGEEFYRVNAYRRAARIVDDLAVDVADLAESDELTKVSGIGKGLAGSIMEYLETGTMKRYEDVKKGVPKGVADLLAIPGLGPKTIGLVWKKLGVTSLRGLKKALKGTEILDLPGMGEKKVDNIAAGIKAYESRSDRMTLGEVLPTARGVVDDMKGVKEVGKISLAGSVRRGRSTIGDIDVLVSSKKPRAVIRAFTELPCAEEVLQAGTTKASIRASGAMQIDLRVISPESYGAALQYFTGSQAHNVRLRGIAKDKGLKLSEYGLFKDDRMVAGRTEEAVYSKLGLDLIPPELREDRGEIEAALGGSLPNLVRARDIKGDLHVHSTWSDGASKFTELAGKAHEMGYEYIVISDHSQSLGVARGLSIDRIQEQIEEIHNVNRRLKGITLLTGSEVDIRSDGSLDFPDEILERLDVVIAAIHSGFRQSADRITGRILSAMDNPHANIIAHPTGALLGIREAYAVDMERVMAGAAETGTALEINAYQQRLDLSDVNARRAADMGAMIALGTDSHHVDQMWMMELGVSTARRAWLGRKHVLNTRTKSALIKLLHKKAGKRKP